MFLDLAASLAVTQPTELVPVEIADELVDERGGRGRLGTNAVGLELFEHLRAVVVGHVVASASAELTPYASNQELARFNRSFTLPMFSAPSVRNQLRNATTPSFA